MSSYCVKTPVVFMIFRRPNTTAKVFEIIRQVKPSKLFVVADGPRLERPEEAEKCADARNIISQVDWDCEVIKNYSDINLGVSKRISTGLDWVFEHTEEAIILEDDCLPHPTFFQFCEELLERYRNDARITSISGQNVQLGNKRTEFSYYFSYYNHIWGWATWKRAWQNFDLEMKNWPYVKERKILQDILNDPQGTRYWHEKLESTYQDLRITWDDQWTLACWLQSGLCILPRENLISNIGFNSDGTNIRSHKGRFFNLYANSPTVAMDFPLKHPSFVIRNNQADAFTQKTLYRVSWRSLLKKRLQKMLK
jgi:hypothetical protein